MGPLGMSGRTLAGRICTKGASTVAPAAAPAGATAGCSTPPSGRAVAAAGGARHHAGGRPFIARQPERPVAQRTGYGSQ